MIFFFSTLFLPITINCNLKLNRKRNAEMSILKEQKTLLIITECINGLIPLLFLASATMAIGITNIYEFIVFSNYK